MRNPFHSLNVAEKVQEMVGLMDDDTKDLVHKDGDTFPFTYDFCRSANIIMSGRRVNLKDAG